MQYLFVLVNKFQIDLHSNMKKKIFCEFFEKKDDGTPYKKWKNWSKIIFSKTVAQWYGFLVVIISCTKQSLILLCAIFLPSYGKKSYINIVIMLKISMSIFGRKINSILSIVIKVLIEK